ncbi:MAG: T9SS type A sorting domain-containing protein, partial [Bacteroidales bacterium]
AAIDALNAAIAAASTVNSNANATQIEVNNANQTLQTAITTFDSSVNKPVDKAALNTAIISATTAKNNAVVGTQPGQYPQSAIDALTTAITTAQSVNSNASATQIQVDNATSALNAAIETFKKAVIVGTPKNTLIADCEKGNETKLKTFWYSYKTGESTISPLTTAAVPFKMTAGGADGTDSAAIVTGKLVNTGAPAYESCGIGFPFRDVIEKFDNNMMITNVEEVVYDLTGATGISFWHKGDALNFSVMLATTKQEAGHDYNFAVPAHANWTLVEVPFTSLAQASWAPKTPWDPTKITKLQWQVKDGNARDFSFGIDQVYVLGKYIELSASEVDKTVLISAVNTANTLVTASVAGVGNGQYPQTAIDTYKQAIASAKAIVDKATATQTEVDAAIAALAAATTTFNNAKVVVNYTALNSKITEFETALSKAVIGTQPGQYEQSVVDIFTQKLNSVKSVANNTSATQIMVNNALEQATADLKLFTESARSANPTDFTQLQAKVTEALNLKNSAVAGSNPGQYPQVAINEFNTAITAAQTVLNNSSASQATVNLALSDLTAAISTFLSKKVPTADKTLLTTTIANAKATVASAIIGNNPGNYTAEAVKALNDAILIAETVKNNVSASQAEVNNANTSLINALTVFANSVIKVTLNKDSLQTLLTMVGMLLDNAVVGTKPGQYSQAAVNTLASIFNDVQRIFDNASSSQKQIDDAVKELAKAKIEFENSAVKTNIYTVSTVEVKVGPNPTTSILHIRSNETIFMVTVVNTLGKVCLSEIVGSDEFTYSTSSLSNGLYVVIISLSSGEILALINCIILLVGLKNE